MKRFVSLIVTVILVVALTACGRDMNYIIQHEPSISGVVRRVYDNSVLIVYENDEYEVSLNVENSDSCTDLSVGDYVTVYYDGIVNETYPLQINKVYAILLIDPVNREKSLSDHGMDVISMMSDMVRNDGYSEIYGGDISDLSETAKAGDYSVPKAVYEIAISDGYLSSAYESACFEGFSEPIENYMRSRMISGMSAQINAMAGADNVAAGSIFTAGKTFVSEEISEDTLYLYVFESGVPVMISFITGEDMSVSAGGTFIFNDDFSSAAQSQESLFDFLSDYSTEVRMIS